MRTKRCSFIGAMSLAAGAMLAVMIGDPSLSLAQTGNKGAANAQSDKKPGQTCEGLDKKTKAFSDCVKAQAQTTKENKPGTKPGAKTN